MVAFDRLEMLDPPRELRLKRSSHFVHAWQYGPSSSRMYILFVSALPSLYLGPDFVSTCLRQEKAIAANKSSLSMIPVTRSTVERLKKVWDHVTRQQLQQEQQHQEQGGAESPKKAESTCPMKYE
uniref:Uncharacterized protein n=1 Tax=Oryza barthii TaxID=65489 RepID=A0A0D3FHY6_9ORYZ